MIKEALKNTLGYVSLVSAVIPLIIAIKSLLNGNIGEGKTKIFLFSVFLSLVTGLFSFSTWKGKIAVVLFLFFAYCLFMDLTSIVDHA